MTNIKAKTTLTCIANTLVSILCLLHNKLINHYEQRQEMIFCLGKYSLLGGSDLFSEQYRSTNHPAKSIYICKNVLVACVSSEPCLLYSSVFCGPCFFLIWPFSHFVIMEILILILSECMLTPDMDYGYNFWFHPNKDHSERIHMSHL